MDKKHVHERSHKDIWKKEEPEPKQTTPDRTKWIIRTLGILLVLMAVLAFFATPLGNGVSSVLFKANSAQIALNVVNLRNPNLATVTRSGLVSLTDEKVLSLRNPSVTEHWGMVLNCLETGCEDSKFFAMIYVLALEQDIPHRKLITDLIVTQRYWGSEENILVFSKAISDVDAGVAKLGSSKVKTGWQAIVDCDGSCEEKNDIYFNLIKEVIKANA